MKKLLFAIWIVIISSTSCEKSHNDKIPDGIYTGTFQRQLAFGGGDIANVVLTFSSNTWTGQSDMPKYPALCHGTYTIDKRKIIFTNDCIWTAEFDGTLILGGDYTFNLNGNQLGFIRDDRGPSRDTYVDVYNLTKQE
jgi:hypothetical protein